MKNTELIVRTFESRLTLQEFLAERLGLSRNKAKSLMDDRNVFVNRRRIWMARHVLRANDVVEVVQAEAEKPRAGGLRVLHRDDVCVVVDKPAGLLANGPESVEAQARRELGIPSLLAAHRLDRDTSGCLLLVKDQDALEAVSDVFRRHKVRKVYHAIVAGCIKYAEKTITKAVDGKSAVTHLKLLDAGRDASHVLLRIDTGRTHQIRRHMDQLGHPVVGDRQYGSWQEIDSRAAAAPRQMLHASEMDFEHPVTHERVFARSPLPGDFKKCLAIFKLS